MNEDKREEDFDIALRPRRLDDFIGQKTFVENLGIYISELHLLKAILQMNILVIHQFLSQTQSGSTNFQRKVENFCL